ncbi:ATP-binding protein [Psychroserpens sp. NJDZ02]|uniref:ATP-binding protein n=1 Tax=Psychroserpens sp. NJDZ02 TaxID=2570561 RepID=UPI001F0E16CD|nr:ATP-binding protein [Psychroserpens sp. NJDZ02]
MQNLLANVVKLCNRGDSITMSNTMNNKKVLLSISHTGVGIDKANQAKLFEDN